MKLLFLLLASGCVPPADHPTEPLRLRPGAHTLVVVHSRSGHTAAAALELAKRLDASYLRLVTPSGAGDSFWKTPNRNTRVSYSAQIDLTPYDLIVLGSPIWYWRPTAFIYSFIRDRDLSGKRVVLLYTNEGGLSSQAIPEWRELVESRGGRVVDVIGIDRKKDRDVAAAVDRAVDQRSGGWLGR